MYFTYFVLEWYSARMDFLLILVDKNKQDYDIPLYNQLEYHMILDKD